MCCNAMTEKLQMDNHSISHTYTAILDFLVIHLLNFSMTFERCFFASILLKIVKDFPGKSQENENLPAQEMI